MKALLIIIMATGVIKTKKVPDVETCQVIKAELVKMGGKLSGSKVLCKGLN